MCCNYRHIPQVILFALHIFSWLPSCSRVGNKVRNFALECGGESAFESVNERIFKIYLDGKSVSPDDLDRLSLNGTDIKSKLSSKGCFSLDSLEKSIVVLTHKDGRHATIADISHSATGTLNPLNLELMKPINEDPKDKDLVFRDFCADSNRTLYLPAAKLSFFLNFHPFNHLTVMTATGHISKDGLRQSVVLVSNTKLVEPKLEEFTISIPEIHASINSPSQIEIEVIDVYGNKIKSHSCDVYIDPSAPKMLSIAQSPYFANMFVRSKSLESIEFSVGSGIPIRKFEIQYLDSKTGNRDRVESYVPFNDKDGIWKVLAPLPKLSGVKRLLMAVESMSGLKVQEQAVINFGEKTYLDGGVKIAKTSKNEKFILLISYAGLVKVIDIESEKIIFERKFDDDVKFGEITNDGGKVILGLSSSDIILDIVDGKNIRFENQFSKFGFRLHRDQSTVLGTLDSNAFVWLDVNSGEVVRSKKFERSSIKSWKVSDDDTLAFFSADNRKMYLASLADNNTEIEIEPPCGNTLVSLIEFSNSGDFAIFGCDTKVYLQNLRKVADKPVLVFEFNTKVWSIAISPDGNWVASGSMSGEWYALNLQNKKQYPESELESLRKGYKFNTTVNAISFSADSKFLIAGTEDGSAKVFSIDDGDFVESVKADGQILTAGFINEKKKFYIGSIDGVLRKQKIHSPIFAFDVGQRIETLAVSGNILAAGTSPRSDDSSDSAAGTLLFNINSREPIGKMPNSKRVNSISFDSVGSMLLTASEDGTAKLGFLSDLSNSLSIGLNHRKPGRPVRYASMSSDGKAIVIVSSKKASAYHIDQYETPFLSLETSEWMSYAHFSSGNRYITTAAADRIARIHDATDGHVVASYTAKNWIWDADLTPDLSTFVNLNWDNELVIQSTQRDEYGNIIGLHNTSKVQMPNGGEFMALSPDSNWAAVSLWNGQAFMVNLKDRFSYEMKCLPATQALMPVFSPDSNFVAFGQGNAAMVYRVKDGRPVQRAYHADRVTSVGFYGSSLVSGSWDGKVRFTEIVEDDVVDCTSE